MSLKKELEFIKQELSPILTELLKNNLKNIGVKSNANILRDIEVNININDDSLFLEWIVADYIIYIDKGRRAGSKPPPVRVIYDWVKRYNIGDKSLSLAFAISKSIAKNGIKPRPVIDNTIKDAEELISIYIEELIDNFIDITLELI